LGCKKLEANRPSFAPYNSEGLVYARPNATTERKKTMKRTTNRLFALAALIISLAFQADAASNDTIKNQAKVPIMATAEDGTTWIAGEVRFMAVGNTLEVHTILATGIPNARVWAYVYTEDAEPMFQMALTDKNGDLKWKASFTKVPGPAAASFGVVLEVTVEGASLYFSTDKVNPPTVQPN
jgi:hypothetical protein